MFKMAFYVVVSFFVKQKMDSNRTIICNDCINCWVLLSQSFFCVLGKPGTGTQAVMMNAILGRRQREKQVTSGHPDVGRLHTCVLFLVFLRILLLLNFCRKETQTQRCDQI